MHVPTQLIFDKITKQVIGKYDENSIDILDLNLEDIETCKQYNFSYVMPENIVVKKDNKLDEELKSTDDEEEVVGKQFSAQI